jgi:hypothetical protein
VTGRPAEAATTCVFSPSGTTLNLTGDCTTDSTIFVPNGITLNGNGFTITALDPAGGHFLGAIVKNAGASANVTNLKLNTSALADVCDGGNDRLRGIMLEGASGSITNNLVQNIKQGTASGCQEGNGIEVRNAPFDNTGVDVIVTVSGNTVLAYQKTGILVNGSVGATITGNTTVGAGPVNYIAQNGIQIGFGATAEIRGNSVSGNDYTPKDTSSCGILYFQADGVRASQNMMRNNEYNICNFGEKGGGNYNPNP